MTGEVRQYTVEGQTYEVWSDFYMRATYAKSETGETKKIKGNGYIHNDLTVRKAIAATFGHKTFRK